MKENNKKFWLFDPEEHGGEANMYLFFISIVLGIIGIIVLFFK